MAKDNVGSVYMDLELDNKKFNQGIKSSSSGAESAFSSAMGKIGGFIAKAFAVGAIVKFGTTAVKEASKMQSAWTGLNSIIQGTGGSFKEAQNFITEYTKDGLVSISEATTAYKNLLSRGYDTSQIENTMLRLKDSAAFGRQANYDLGEAVVSATEGLKNENSILVDNAGVTKNVAKMWEDYAKAHNTTTSAMTQAQKIEAEYNGIMQETKHQVGDATAYTNTFSGKLSQMNMAFTNLKVAVGKVIAPIAQLFIPVITTAINAVTKLFNTIGTLMRALGIEFPDVVSKSSSGLESIGFNADDTSSKVEGVGDSAKKAAKKINKAFASVDEIQVVSPTKDSGSSGGAGGSSGVGGGIQSSAFDGASEGATQTSGAFDKLIAKFKELQGLFVQGFKIGWNNKSFDKIIEYAGGIKKSLLDIFNNKDLKKSVNTWGNTLALNLGKVAGSVGRIGTNIVESIIGSMNSYLNQNKSRITAFFTKMFTINTEQINLSGQLWEVLGSISDVFTGEAAIQIGSDLLSIFTTPIMTITELFGQFILDMQSIFVQPIVDNAEQIKTTFENILEPISVVTDTIQGAMKDVGDMFKKVYDEHIHPFFEDFKTGISDTFSKALDVYNEYIQPFVEKTADRFKELWDNHLKKLWENITELIGAIADRLKMLWDNFLKPLIDWIIQNIIPKIVPILDKIGDKISKVVGGIIDFISGLVKTLKGLINFVTGVFTGDWEKAWNGVKDIFGGVFDALKELFKIPINWIIDKMNDFIDGLNKIQIPDWVPKVGGKGINIDHIKRLANGGYVEKNNPQLAIIGDNTREGEIVSPESKIYEQTLKAIKAAGGTGKQEIEMTIYHKYEDGKTMIQKINQAQIDAGEVLLLT